MPGVVEALRSGGVQVRSGGGPQDYPVLVGRGLLSRLPELLQERAPAHRYAVIADETVAALHGQRLLDGIRDAGLSVTLDVFPPGEASKTRETWARLTDGLLAAGHGRDSVVVAFGGGVTGDLAGFVAATFMRGIPVVQVPTSLVAMVDAAVGGKTGVDVPGGKNLVGAFHPPRLVAADPDVLATLPRRERAEGLAEVVKHGSVLDAAYLVMVEAEADALLAAPPGNAMEAVVRRSVELKAEVVGRDEREGGIRQILNFGHTLGHAFEAASDYRLSHGAAVGLGMVLEARLGERLGITEPGTSVRLARIVSSLGHPVRPEYGRPAEIVSFTRADKKARAGRSRYVLLARAGEVARGDGWSHEVSEDVVTSLLAEG